VTTALLGTVASSHAQVGVTKLVLPGVIGNYLVTATNKTVTATGDLEVIVRVSQANWETDPVTYQGFAAQFDGPVAGRSWVLRRTGGLVRQISVLWADSAGVVQSNYAVNYNTGLFTNNQLVWWKLGLDVDNGASQHVATLSYALDASNTEPTSWTLINTTPRAGTTTVRAVAVPIVVGSDAVTLRASTGRVARVIVRSGGTTLFDMRDTDATIPGQTALPATVGGTVNVTQTAGNTIVQAGP
jgi:hypothetical protein